MTRAGSLSRDDNGYTVRHVTELPANPDDVWSELIEPTRLELWLTTAELDAVPGGAVDFIWPGESEMRGVIEEVEPPRRLRYSWSERDCTSELAFDVEAVSAETSRLTLTHNATSEDDPPGFAAGWQSHLQSLAAIVSGDETSTTIRDARYEELGPADDELLAAL